MRSSSVATSFVLASLFGLVACGGATPDAATPASTSAAADAPKATTAGSPQSDKVTWKNDSAKSCHWGKAAGDLTTAVTSMATGCVATAMHQVGSPTTGSGAASTSSMVTTIPLKAQANHCYRIFGIAEPTVTDLDIAVIDSAGKSCGEDGTDTNEALVLENGSICFKTDDAVNVNAAVAAGQGKWAVEIWSN